MSLLRSPNIYYGSARRRRVGRPRGRGIFSSIGNALRGAHDWIKKNKIISTVSGALSGVPGIGNIAGMINKGSTALGYGRRRVTRRVKRRRVGGAFDFRGALSKAHSFVKGNRLISKGLSALGHPKLASAAGSLGYGRRRKRVVRRRRGGAFDLRGALSKVHSFVKNNRLISKGLSAINHPKLASAAGSLGYGRRRRPVRRPMRRPRGGAVKRRTVRRPRRHGGANFFSTEQLAAPKW